MKSEMGIRTEEGAARVRQQNEREKNVPGVDYSDRQRLNLQREASSVKPSQATEHFKIQGGTVDVLA